MKDYGNGHFRRDPEDGTWRYTLTGNAVPGARDVSKGGKVVAMFAPELLPDRLLDGRAAAALTDRTYGGFKNAVNNGTGPAAVGRIGKTPYWTEGVIREWLSVQAAKREASFVA